METNYESIAGSLEDLSDIFTSAYGLAELGVMGILLLITIITTVVSFLVSAVLYVVQAIPVYTAAKKVGSGYAWLAWMPILSSYCLTFVLADIARNKPVALWKDYKIQNRANAFWIYVAIRVFGSAIAGSVVALLSFIPVIGQFGSIIVVVLPLAAKGYFEYVFLRDTLDVFKPDKKANSNAALIVTILDSFITLGFARAIYIYTIHKLNPLASEPIVQNF